MDVEKKTVMKAETGIIDFFRLLISPGELQILVNFLFERVDRGHQRFRIIEVDAATAQTRTIVDEKTQTFIYEQKIYTAYIPETNEIIWISEKDGWRHIYLVNSISDW